MYTLIGKENCGRCEMAKTILKNKNIPFNYELISDLSNERRLDIIDKAQEMGIATFPIIMNENDEIITLEEVK